MKDFGKISAAVPAIGLSLLIGILSGCSEWRSAKWEPASPRAVASASTRPAGHNFSRWEKEIAAYEQADRDNPPPKGGILFIGSSTIRLWKTLAQDFPNHKVINRGFGGSEIVDSTYFADRLIFPHEPRMIFLRAGGNDIHAGKLPEEVLADFVDFVETVHRRLPRTEIVFISLCPAPARWTEKDKGQALNEMVCARALRMPRVSYVECDSMSLTPDHQPRHELFADDKLHFNAEGYKLLANRVRPYLPVK